MYMYRYFISNIRRNQVPYQQQDPEMSSYAVNKYFIYDKNVF